MLKPIVKDGHQLLAVLPQSVRPLKMCGHPVNIVGSDVLLNAPH